MEKETSLKDEIYSAFEDATCRPLMTKKKLSTKTLDTTAEAKRDQGRESIRTLVNKHGKGTIRASVGNLLQENKFSRPSAVSEILTLFCPDSPVDEMIESERQPRRVENSSPPPLPSLFPAHLPFESQHEVMGTLQNYLESLCFEFAQKKMSGTLYDHGWDCPKSVQLNHWMDIFILNDGIFHMGCNPSPVSLEKLFNSIAEIRHIAVRRTPIDSDRMKTALLDAVALAELLDVKRHTDIITNFQRVVNQKIENLHKKKHELRSRLDEELSAIALERSRLKDRESAAVLDIYMKDEKLQDQIGEELLLTLRGPGDSINSVYLNGSGHSEEWDDGDGNSVVTPSETEGDDGGDDGMKRE